MKLRVEPLVRFYQCRLPLYGLQKTIGEICVVMGSLAGAILAMWHIEHWTGFASSILCAFMAW